ncbi:HD domain-containing phosphohydrolase [Desulfosarcina sp.]|uniref:HD domain-containing phosphohydrolase n=1 Tax=Desulfosarcina sp. TaxID=2027861 RepID=UPI00356883A6
MIKNILRQNKVFFAIVLLIAIFFSVVLYFGVSRIYDRESRWRHETASLELDVGKIIVQSFFANFKHHLFFIRDMTSVRNFANSDFKSERYQTEVQGLIHNFSRASEEIYQIRILDAEGREVVRIDTKPDGKPLTVAPENLNNEERKNFFQEALYRKDHIYISLIDLNVDHGTVEDSASAVIRIVSSLFDNNGKQRGLLIVTVDVSKLFQILPKNMFVQTKSGMVLSLRADGSLTAKTQGYHLDTQEGKLVVSDTETIHYSTVNLFSGRQLVIGLYHHHIGLKTALQRLIWLSAMLFIIFIGLVIVLSNIDIRRLNERNRAQMAIVTSLVELTDSRDPQTGAHLLRTKTFAMQLAKQLKKSNKYANIISKEFIENIYETAPLHDIGKVGIQDSILLKASKLDFEEIQEMRQHPLIGGKVLQDIIDQYGIHQPFIIMAKNIAAFHHERFDGTGYPEGLKGENIPLEARIFALADVYDALRSERPYKQSLSHIEVINKIQSESGKHFDPDIVNAFLTIEKMFSELIYNDHKNTQNGLSLI